MGNRKRTFGALRMGYLECGEDPDRLLELISDGGQYTNSLRRAIYAGVKLEERG
jgi:hypothetical protein